MLAIASGPAEGLKVSKARVEAALRRAGRQRRAGTLAASITAALRVPQLRQEPVVEQAMGVETLTLLGGLDAVCGAGDQLSAALGEAFRQHPDYQIITSFPGLADVSGAIVLAETGDDRNRFGDDRALQAFAGSAPVTRASGKSRTVTRRRTKNNRLAAVGYSWAFSARIARVNGAPGDVGAGSGTAAYPADRDVHGTVQCPAATAVEPVPDRLAAAGGDRAGAAQSGESGLVRHLPGPFMPGVGPPRGQYVPCGERRGACRVRKRACGLPCPFCHPPAEVLTLAGRLPGPA